MIRALVLTALLVLAPAATRAQDVGLALGVKPAAAQVEDLDGNAVDLGKYVGGKPALFEFWATWCPLCKALEPKLEAAKKTFGEKVDIVIVAVGVGQTPRQIKRHLADHPLPGPVFFDAKGAAVRAFMTPTTSYIVILDSAGKVTYTGTGDDQRISEALAKVAR